MNGLEPIANGVPLRFDFVDAGIRRCSHAMDFVRDVRAYSGIEARMSELANASTIHMSFVNATAIG